MIINHGWVSIAHPLKTTTDMQNIRQIAMTDYHNLCRLVEGKPFDGRPFEDTPLFQGYGAVPYDEDVDFVDVNFNNICATVFRGNDGNCFVGLHVEVYQGDDIIPVAIHTF